MKLATAIGSVLLTVVLVAGCEFLNSDRTLGENIVILNGTSDTIEVLAIRDGVESRLATIEPGRGYRISAALYPDGCLPDPLVARVADGTPIARNDARLCSGDQWEVTEQAAPSGSSWDWTLTPAVSSRSDRHRSEL